MQAPTTCLRRRVILGLDMGRNYIAWAVLREVTRGGGLSLIRHGFIQLPDLGGTVEFGHTLTQWRHFFEWFVRKDVRPDVIAAERFTYRPGSGAAQSSEDVNLFLSQMSGINMFFLRNTDWKGWMTKQTGPDWQGYFGMPTPHEADAIGIACYGWFVRDQQMGVKKVAKKAPKKKKVAKSATKKRNRKGTTSQTSQGDENSPIGS